MNTTENIPFTPIPNGLPALPPYDATTHWPRYRGTEWAGNVPLYYYCTGKHWKSNKGETAAGSAHYLTIEPINYADENYRKYVEDAFANGAKIEGQAIGKSDWVTQYEGEPFYWHNHIYRVAAQPAPPAVETEVDYFSEEYQVGLFKRWKSGEELKLQSWLKSLKIWADDSGYTRRFWEVGCFYREKPKPAPPKQVPLESKDIPPVCWIKFGNATVFNLIHCVDSRSVFYHGTNNQYEITFAELASEGWKYSTDLATWKACSKLSTEDAK
jgi:hypothetical protein